MMIRPAGRADITWLLEQLREFARSADLLALFPDDEAVATAVIDGFIVNAQQGLGLFLVAETTEGVRTGFIVASLGNHPFNPRTKVLAEHFWWVRADRRGAAAGGRLLDAFEGFAARHNAEPVLSLLHSSPDLDESLARRGYRVTERCFMRIGRTTAAVA
jgi:hypothetical protein